MSITVQQDATINSFFYISANCSTCFGWYLDPSSGAHVNCNYNIWHWSNRICYLPMSWRSRTPPRQRKVANTVRPVPDAVITVYVCSWWWVKVSPETCRAVCRNRKKTVYSRILLDIYWHCHGQCYITKVTCLGLNTGLYDVSVICLQRHGIYCVSHADRIPFRNFLKRMATIKKKILVRN